MATYYNSNEAVPDIPGATYLELKARFKVLAGVVDAVGAERKALNDEIKRREVEAAVQTRVNNLSADGRRALRGVVNSPEFEGQR